MICTECTQPVGYRTWGIVFVFLAKLMTSYLSVSATSRRQNWNTNVKTTLCKRFFLFSTLNTQLFNKNKLLTRKRMAEE